MPKKFQDLLGVILSTMVDQGIIREGKIEKLSEKVGEKMSELQETWDEKETHRKEVAALEEELEKAESRGKDAEFRFKKKEEQLEEDCEERLTAIATERDKEIAELEKRFEDKEGVLEAAAENRVRKELSIERGVVDGLEAKVTALEHANDYLKADAVELRKQNEEVRKDYKAIVEKALSTAATTGVAQVFVPQQPGENVKRKDK